MMINEWCVETIYNEDQVIALSLDDYDPEARADANTTYSVFASLPEAAQRFLSEIEANPSAYYREAHKRLAQENV